VGGSVGQPDAGTKGDPTPGGAGAGELDEPCAEDIAPTSQLVRLTGKEYDKTLFDLLGVTTLNGTGNDAPSSVLSPDSESDMTDAAWAGYQTAAAALAAQVIADAALHARFIACAPNSEQSACLHDTIVTFGRRAFRRPLTDTEVARFDSIGARGSELTEHGTLDEVAQLILETFLVSPSFLDRVELEETPDGRGNVSLSSYEIATRLSYLFLGSMPDATLDAAANAGKLGTAGELLAQAERLAADPRFSDAVRAFHQYYVGVGIASHWGHYDKSPERFPAFTNDLGPALTEETDRFFANVVVDTQGSFPDLFLSTAAFVNASTAGLYGVDSSGLGVSLEPATLEAGVRPGFLTRSAFLAAYAHQERTAPEWRGAFVLYNVLGKDLGPCAAGPSTAAPFTPELDTVRKLVTAQNAGPACTGCHALIDPLGFVFEAFNAVGAIQAAESDTGAPIDTSADVTIDDELVHVSGPAELMQRLATSREARRRYAERWVSFALRRDHDARDACIVDTMTRELAESDAPVLQMLTALPLTAPFRLRTREAP